MLNMKRKDLSISNCFQTSSSSEHSPRTKPEQKAPTVEQSNHLDALPESIPIIEKNYSLEPDMING